ncbi:hypothetical protein HID58_088608, partial [Brassica napus]
MATRFVDFILSLFISLFSHLVAPVIADHVSGGSSFRHICYSRLEKYFLYVVYGLKLKLLFFGGWLPFSPTQSFVVFRWHGRLVCACLVCELVVVL